MGENWGMALLESHEVASFVLGLSVVPATPQDANPFEGESAEDGLPGDAAGAPALVEGLGPEATGDRLASPLDEGLAEESGGDEAPAGPRLVAAALDHRRDAGAFLNPSGVGETVPVLAEDFEESRCQRRTAAGQRSEELEVGQPGGPSGDSRVEAATFQESVWHRFAPGGSVWHRFEGHRFEGGLRGGLRFRHHFWLDAQRGNGQLQRVLRRRPTIPTPEH